MTSSRFSKWWKDNPEKAEAIRERRRKKYANDETYRRRERERKRTSRAKPKFAKTYPKPKLYPVGDKIYELWSVGRVAETLGIHKRTLSGLEARGAIPINRYVDVNGRRWWPRVYVEWLQPYFDMKNNRKISSQEFSSRVWNDWSIMCSKGTLPVIGETSESRQERSSG